MTPSRFRFRAWQGISYRPSAWWKRVLFYVTGGLLGRLEDRYYWGRRDEPRLTDERSVLDRSSSSLG